MLLYKVVECKSAFLQVRLNELGKSGWELVSCTAATDDLRLNLFILVLKQKVEV